jgi:hypothetical protein
MKLLLYYDFLYNVIELSLPRLEASFAGEFFVLSEPALLTTDQMFHSLESYDR